VCPTGIDIRDGLQIDCISCAACIDACDSVMDKMGYPRGLVGYYSERELQGGKTHWLRPRLIGYGIALVLMLAAFAWVLSARSMLSIDSAKDRSMFRENQLGQIENTYLLKVINKTQQPQRYGLALVDSPGLRLDAPQQLQLNPGEILDVPVTVVLERENAEASTLPVRFAIHNLADASEQAQTQSTFLSPRGR
jgi:cytochrome c oxidase accessory protein FixG